MGKFSQRKQSHIICELMAIEKEISSEEQIYFAHSMNTMCVVKGDKLFSENDKLCFSVSIIQQRILAIKSEYVSRSESGIQSNRFTSIFITKVSWTTRQN